NRGRERVDRRRPGRDGAGPRGDQRSLQPLRPHLPRHLRRPGHDHGLAAYLVRRASLGPSSGVRRRGRGTRDRIRVEWTSPPEAGVQDLGRDERVRRTGAGGAGRRAGPVRRPARGLAGPGRPSGAGRHRPAERRVGRPPRPIRVLPGRPVHRTGPQVWEVLGRSLVRTPDRLAWSSLLTPYALRTGSPTAKAGCLGLGWVLLWRTEPERRP